MSARLLSLLALAALLGGCNTYLEAKSDIASGRMQQRVSAAEARYTEAQQQNEDLKDRQLALQRDLERNERRIAAAQSELDGANAALQEARAKKRLSAAQYDRLRREADALNGELALLDLQLQTDRGRAGAGPDIAAKEARLRELERRKAELERAISQALGS